VLRNGDNVSEAVSGTRPNVAGSRKRVWGSLSWLYVEIFGVGGDVRLMLSKKIEF
jgi:hypothetical protein